MPRKARIDAPGALHHNHYNRRHRCHGHLFQNRYKSFLCEEDVYLKELVRYISAVTVSKAVSLGSELPEVGKIQTQILKN